MRASVRTHAEPDLFARSKLPQLCGGHIELLAHVRSRPTGHGRARCCRAARVLRKRYGVLHFYFDVFNLFNANTVTAVSNTLGRNWLRIDDILPPRVIRLGGAWDF